MTVGTFLIAIIAALVLIIVFASIALFAGDSNFFKNKQNKNSAVAAFNRSVHRAATFKNFEVMENTTLEFDGQKYSFDAILLSSWGTIGIKASYAKGDIYGGVNDVNWLCVPNTTVSKKEYFENPVREISGSVKFFKELYKSEKVKGGSSDSFVVFPFGKTQLYLGKNTPAYKVEDLQKVLSEHKYSADNGADVQAMKTALEKYSVK